MKKISVMDYPARRKVREALKNTLHFDGASHLERGEFAQKFGFETLMYRKSLPTVVRAMGRKKSGGRSIYPRAFGLHTLEPHLFPQPILQSSDASTALSVFALLKAGVGARMLNVWGDEVWYVFRGEGVCVTALGILPYRADDFLYIPQLVPYRLFSQGTEKTCLVGIESRSSLLRPSGDQGSIPYNSNDIVLPEPVDPSTFDTEDPQGGFLLRLKQGDDWQDVCFEEPVFDCIGYDGSIYPFILHTDAIDVRVALKNHTDPNRFAVFATEENDVMVSIFLPRPVHSLPYYHSNRWDECSLYTGEYGARGGTVLPGDMVFHPAGFPHGPQIEAFLSTPEVCPVDAPWVTEGAVMFESRKPLIPTAEASLVEERDYWKSWHEGWLKQKGQLARKIS